MTYLILNLSDFINVTINIINNLVFQLVVSTLCAIKYRVVNIFVCTRAEP